MNTKKIATAVGVAAAALVLSASASAATLPGHHVGTGGSVTGEFAVTGAQADVKNPRQVWVRATGRGADHITVVTSCNRGFNIASNTLIRRRAGVYRIPTMPHAETCSVIASVGGVGHITLEVRAA